MPFQCCAASIERAAEHWFTEGRVADAVMASAAVPGLLPPAEVDGEHYLDGGIVNSIPVGRAVECGASRIFVLQVGRVDRPLSVPRRAVGGRPGVVRDRPPAPLPPGDGRAARRTSTAHVLPTGGGSPKDDSLLAYRDFAAVTRRIDAGVRRRRRPTCAEHL